MSKTKILIIVEGAKTEVNLMQLIFELYELNIDYEIISYKTNIYALYNQMFKNKKPEEMDIKLVLKEQEDDPIKKKIFDENFSDILLIFDLDPHDLNYSEWKIKEMQSYFSESTEMGKLFINYPMVESFYHMKEIPDYDYNNYVVFLDELKMKKYKSRVNQETRYKSYSKFITNKSEFSIVIQQNLDKIKMILENYDLDGADYLFQLLVKQLDLLEKYNYIYIICTCILFVYEYNPKLVKEKIRL